MSFLPEGTIRALNIFKALAICSSRNANIDLHYLKLYLGKLRNLSHLELSPSPTCGKCHLGEVVEGMPEGKHTS